jgi:hypothetical protein
VAAAGIACKQRLLQSLPASPFGPSRGRRPVSGAHFGYLALAAHLALKGRVATGSRNERTRLRLRCHHDQIFSEGGRNSFEDLLIHPHHRDRFAINGPDTSRPAHVIGDTPNERTRFDDSLDALRRRRGLSLSFRCRARYPGASRLGALRGVSLFDPRRESGCFGAGRCLTRPREAISASSCITEIDLRTGPARHDAPTARLGKQTAVGRNNLPRGRPLLARMAPAPSTRWAN